MQRKELGVWRHGVYIIIIIFNITIYYNYIPFSTAAPTYGSSFFANANANAKKCKELPIDQDKNLHDGGWERM